MARGYADFTRPAYRDPRWLETNWFSFVTDDGIRVHFWVGFRVNLEVASTKVYAFSRDSASVLDMDFVDTQYHVPIAGDRLGDYALASGISVKGTPAPDRYRISYASKCGRMQATLEAEALMAPVGLDFTAITGAERGFTAFHRTRGTAPEDRAGDEPVGHIDQTMRVRGTLTIDGVSHDVDCIANRDHSWSPRAEYRNGIGTFDLFHFGEELTLLTHTAERDGRAVVSNGYVLVGGEARRLRSAEVEHQRRGFRTHRITYRVVDDQGDAYEIAGTSRAGAEIDGGQNILLVLDLFDAEWAGRTGYGEVQWHDDITRVQRERREAMLRG
ncbi:DUF7064 domain-containing protein [Microbacterium gorillae]|uniref:DUF7064 domain-containing protein n=1 Tax=Microbacterium gorillae TaxID=1231063 RepID=UPI00058F8641|nr:hypothetical protein [Microbacterium gorillae]